MARPATRSRSLRPSERLGAVVALVLVVAGAWSCGAGTGPPTAVAEVVHGVGFEATVLGWTSWYGNYGLGDLGFGWCIDHGLLAPDAALGYVPTEVTDASADTRAAVSWAITRNPPSDAVTSAAVMLVAHDLMGAQYPFGRIDVDTMGLANLGGFGGHEGALLAAARRIKADTLAHARLRAPFRIDVVAAPVDPGARGHLAARVVDAGGAGVAGITVTVAATGATLAGNAAPTDATGQASVAFTAAEGANAFTAAAAIPDPSLHAFAPTRARAQRIAQPHELRVTGATAFTPASTSTTVPSTTTTTARTTPPTTAPPSSTTTTTRPPTAATPPPTTATSTTSPPPPTSTTPPVTTASSTTTTATPTIPPSPPAGPGPPTRSAPPSTTAGALPVTGSTSRGIVSSAVGLLLLGASLVGFGRRRAGFGRFDRVR